MRGEAGKQDEAHLMLSSSFLPGHQVPTPMKLPPLGLTVGLIIRKGGWNGEVVPTASIVDRVLGQCDTEGNLGPTHGLLEG